jgi:hypothetical protein
MTNMMMMMLMLMLTAAAATIVMLLMLFIYITKATTIPSVIIIFICYSHVATIITSCPTGGCCGSSPLSCGGIIHYIYIMLYDIAL